MVISPTPGIENYIETADTTDTDRGHAKGWDIDDYGITRASPTNWVPTSRAAMIRINGVIRVTSRPNVPTTPRVVSSIANQTVLEATWSKPDDDGVLPTTGYQYRVNNGPRISTTDTAATLPNLSPGNLYEVRVRAVNGKGEVSAWSAPGYGIAGGKGSSVLLGNTAQENSFTEATHLASHDLFQRFSTGDHPDGYISPSSTTGQRTDYPRKSCRKSIRRFCEETGLLGRTTAYPYSETTELAIAAEVGRIRAWTRADLTSLAEEYPLP